MKKIILSLIVLLTAVGAAAQEPQKPKSSAAVEPPQKVRATLYGFVRNYYTYDSRNMYTVIGGEYDMLPYDRKMEGDVDVNDYDNSKFLAISSRFGIALEGPNVWGATTSGRIEADFGGFSTTNSVLRIRLAFLKLHWLYDNGNAAELLAGQDWHPMSGNIMPDALGMAAGAPFRPHSRTPQVRYAFNFKNGFGLTAAALYQLQYMYNGPSGTDVTKTTASTSFANNAVVPELFFGLGYKSSHIFTQIGVDVQTLQPRNFGKDALGNTIRVEERFTSFSPTLYFQYTREKFGLKCRTLLAQNTSHLNQLNGYAIVGTDGNGSYDYAPLRASISYLNMSYGKTFKGNLFLGYMKNLGTDQNLYPVTNDYCIFVKGGSEFTHLNSIWRVAPAFSYNLKHFNIGLEYEVTGATYGDLDVNGSILNNGNLHQVVNHRICVLTKYNF